MKTSRILILCLSLIASGCAATATPPLQPSGTSQSAVDGARLTAELDGDTVRLTLTNGTDRTVGYNLCHSLLERREAGAWREVRTDEVCTMELRMLEPGRSTSIDKTWPPNAGSGEFRYRTNVEMQSTGGMTVVTTEPFRR